MTMADNVGALIKLSRVRLKYDVSEDRIAMVSESDSGETMRLWLTHKLSREIAKAMLDELAASVLKRSSVRDSGSVQEILHNSANSEGKKPSHSSFSKPMSSHLLHRIQFQTTDKSIILRIPLEQNTLVVLPLGHSQARQWMSALYRQFKRAAWPLDIWPKWYQENQSSFAGAHKKAVH